MDASTLSAGLMRCYEAPRAASDAASRSADCFCSARIMLLAGRAPTNHSMSESVAWLQSALSRG